MGRLVVIDASPLIGLAIVDGLQWLPELFGKVYLPPSVQNEVLPGKNAKGEAEIANAIEQGWITIWPEPITSLPDIDLDPGETDCISLALQFDGNALVIMDERSGRAVVQENGLRVAGTAAIIGLAKKHGLIDSARKVFEVLHESDFRISASVIQQVLNSVDE